MTTISVLDSTGATQTVAKVVDTGSAADADSLPVTQSTEDKAALAAVTTTLGIKVTSITALESGGVGVIGWLSQLWRDNVAGFAKLPASLGSKPVAASLATSVKSGGNEYETVAASQTNQALGATGATGDYVEGLLCVVSTAATSQVQIKDGSGSAITVLPNNVGGGVGSYYVPLGLTSTSGAWQVTTAAGVAVIATGDFT